jgi:hypothetical protein
MKMMSNDRALLDGFAYVMAELTSVHLQRRHVTEQHTRCRQATEMSCKEAKDLKLGFFNT